MHNRIENMYKNTIFHMMGNVFPFPLTMQREGRINEMLDHFKDQKNVEKFVKELQERVGEEVKIKLVKHNNNKFDVVVDHTYHFDIKDIGIIDSGE